MDAINLQVDVGIPQVLETNVNWFANGEPISASVLNRPILQIAGLVNTLNTELQAAKNTSSDDAFLSALLFGGE
jgi:hypothetical protein